MTDDRITIAPEPFDSLDAQKLITALDAELAGVYLPAQMFGKNLRAEHLEAGRGVFLVARAEGRAIGCGALRRLDDGTAEVKRMYVEPGLRGQGIARAILDHLEHAARQWDVRRLVLETGIHQAAAITLYTRAGFTPIDCFGEYAGSSTSLCFAKLIG